MTARTDLDDAMIGVAFTQRKGGEQSAYSFGLSDFDRDYGRWDFLGTNPVNTVGTLVYSGPSGGQVTLTFLADRNTAQGECAFSGIATYAAPPGRQAEASGTGSAEEPAAEATAELPAAEPVQCPVDDPGEFGAGNWRGSVANISCQAAGRLIYGQLGREFRPTTAESGTHNSAGFRCAWRMLEKEPGWRLNCVRANQAIVFDWTP